MVKRISPLLLVPLFLPLFVQAEELKLRLGMTGLADLGAISCETYNAMYPNGPTGMRQASLYYAEGYLLAKTDRHIDELLAGKSEEWTFDSLTDVVVNYCADHPDVPVSRAIQELAERLLN